ICACPAWTAGSFTSGCGAKAIGFPSSSLPRTGTTRCARGRWERGWPPFCPSRSTPRRFSARWRQSCEKDRAHHTRHSGAEGPGLAGGEMTQVAETVQTEPEGELPEGELVERLRRREADAAEALVTAYGDRVYRLALRITGNPSDAEEVVQDAFWTVTRKIDTFRGDAAFGSWLYRITANAAYQKLRR